MTSGTAGRTAIRGAAWGAGGGVTGGRGSGESAPNRFLRWDGASSVSRLEPWRFTALAIEANWTAGEKVMGGRGVEGQIRRTSDEPASMNQCRRQRGRNQVVERNLPREKPWKRRSINILWTFELNFPISSQKKIQLPNSSSGVGWILLKEQRDFKEGEAEFFPYPLLREGYFHRPKPSFIFCRKPITTPWGGGSSTLESRGIWPQIWRK